MARTNNYCDIDTDVRVLISLVTDWVVDDDVGQYFIDRADNYIDSRLAIRYSVPFKQTTAPPILTDISANLAAYGIIKRLKIETNENEQDYARTFYNDGMRMLKELREGTTDILDTSGNIIYPLSQTGIISSTSRYQPVFNEGDPINWGVSSDKIRDENDRYS